MQLQLSLLASALSSPVREGARRQERRPASAGFFLPERGPTTHRESELTFSNSIVQPPRGETPPRINTNHPTEQSRRRRFLRLREVVERVGLSRTRIYELIGAERFPKQIKLSDRASAWLESDVDAWMDARIADTEAK